MVFIVLLAVMLIVMILSTVAYFIGRAIGLEEPIKTYFIVGLVVYIILNTIMNMVT